MLTYFCVHWDCVFGNYFGDVMIEPIVDISTHQDNVSRTKLLASGVRGVYAKAGYCYYGNGSCWKDSWYQANSDKFSPVIPFGAYWWFHPGYDGEMQGRFFVDLLNKSKWSLPPAVDVEDANHSVSQHEYQYDLKKCLDVIEEETGVIPVIYTRATYWNPHVGNPSWASRHKLWIAIYNSWIKHPWKGLTSYLKPAPWDDYWLWQYSEKGDGPTYGMNVYKSKSIDLDRCNMTEEEWSLYMPNAPEVPEVDETKVLKDGIKEVIEKLNLLLEE